MLEDHANALADGAQVTLTAPDDILAVDHDPAFIRPFQPVQAAQQRGFAGTGSPDHAEHLATLEREGNIGERLGLPKPAAETLDRHQGGCVRRPRHRDRLTMPA